MIFLRSLFYSLTEYPTLFKKFWAYDGKEYFNESRHDLFVWIEEVEPKAEDKYLENYVLVPQFIYNLLVFRGRVLYS